MKAVVVGTGPGASTAAMVLTDAGWDVVLFEKARSYFGDLTVPAPETRYGNDELKMRRGFGAADPTLEPRVFRYRADQEEPVAVGNVNTLPVGVGGGTTQWDAKTPRFWDIDFHKATMLGPIEGADIIDWPVGYDDMVPYYEVAEELFGVAGSIDEVHATAAGRHARHRKPLPQPPGVDQLGSLRLAEGARKVGLSPLRFPAAINSTTFDDRPPCISCGHCSGYGCPIHDKGSALIPLRRALLTGRAEVRDESIVTRIEHDGTKATGVRWVDRDGHERTEAADFVVVGGGPVETARLALRSEVPDPGGMVGRYLMYHWFTIGFGVWFEDRIHGIRGRSVSHALYDFCDPDYPGAREAARAAGLPYFRGGVVEMGGSPEPLNEAFQYIDLLEQFQSDKPFGRRFKELMHVSPLRDRLSGAQMIAEDLPQATNRVDLDPKVNDRWGLAAARITYKPHHHELAAQDFYLPELRKVITAAGAAVVGVIPETGTEERPSPTGDTTPIGYHTMGGMRMAADRSAGATDGFGRLWGLQNVGIADGSVFPSSGAHNPTLTIVAMAWRNARAWAGQEGAPTAVPAAKASASPSGGSSSGGSASGAAGSSGASSSSGVSPAVVVGGVAAGAAVIGGVAWAATRKGSSDVAAEGPTTDAGPAGTATAPDADPD